MIRADVLVLGGGPAGAALAAFAAEAGASTVVVERRAFPRDKVCGEFVSAEGVRVLARLGVLDALLASDARWIGDCRVTSPGGRDLAAPLPDLPGIGSRALGVSRRLLDTTLLDRARRAGAVVLERLEAVAPSVEGGRVRGVALRRVGECATTPARAPVVVAADGRRSVLVRALHPHLGDPRRSGPRSRFGLETHLAADPAALDGRVELHLFDGGYAGLGAVEGGRVNLCLMTTVAALRECGGSPDRLLRERVGANPAVEGFARAPRAGPWKSVGPLGFGVRRAAAAGALFVGDAAGTIDPFCGEGIAHALRAGEMAAPFAVEAAHRGELGGDLAAAYREAWRGAFGAVTRAVRLIGRMTLDRPRLAGRAVDCLSLAGAPLFPLLVARTRTGSYAPRHPVPTRS